MSWLFSQHLKMNLDDTSSSNSSFASSLFGLYLQINFGIHQIGKINLDWF